MPQFINRYPSVTIVAIIRLAFFIRVIYFTPPTDSNYSISFVLSRIETGLAVITASASSLKPLIRQYIPRLLGQSGTPNNQHSGERARSRLSQQMRSDAFQIGRIVPWDSKVEVPDDDSQREALSGNRPPRSADKAEDLHDTIQESRGKRGFGSSGFV